VGWVGEIAVLDWQIFFAGKAASMSSHLFTSESVSEGHPDKVADQISDAVLDAILAQDKTSRVAAETLVKDNMVVLAGEITTGARVNFSEVVRKTVKRIGYNDPTIGFDTHTWQLAWTLTTFLYRRGRWHDWVVTLRAAIATAAAERIEIGAAARGDGAAAIRGLQAGP